MNCYFDGKRIALPDLPLPGRVVALTLTPFDKFPFQRRDEIGLPTTYRRSSIYKYLGIRDGTNRSSIMSLLYRSVENLFDAALEPIDKLYKISSVFSFLGYKPSVTMVYTLDAYRDVLHTLASGDAASLLTDESISDSFRSRLASVTRKQEPSIRTLSGMASRLLSLLGRGRYLTLPLDFDAGIHSIEDFEIVQTFRKLRIVRLAAIEVTREDGTVVDLKTTSSGELSIVTAFLGLASVIENGALVLIDEPEISLHPEWQSAYLDLLIRTFSAYVGCHFAVATHSPLILSNIDVVRSYVVSMDSDTSLRARDLGGKSSDYLLMNAFHVPARDNLYLKQRVIFGLRLLADGKVSSREFRGVREELLTALSLLPNEDPVGTLIAEMIAAADAVAQEG